MSNESLMSLTMCGIWWLQAKLSADYTPWSESGFILLHLCRQSWSCSRMSVWLHNCRTANTDVWN